MRQQELKNSELYALVTFPNVQKYMEHPDFFSHCYACVDIDGAYFVELEWANTNEVTEFINQQ